MCAYCRFVNGRVDRVEDRSQGGDDDGRKGGYIEWEYQTMSLIIGLNVASTGSDESSGFKYMSLYIFSLSLWLMANPRFWRATLFISPSTRPGRILAPGFCTT